MHIAAAQILCADHFTRRCFDQRRAGQENCPLLFYNNRHIRHRRHIGPACGTGAHHHSDLRDAPGAHLRLIVEDAPKMIAIRKHLVLVGQVRAAGIHQIHAGQVAFRRNLLGAQMLFHGHRIIGAALHRGIVADDHHVAPMHTPHARNHTRRRRGPVIKPMRRHRTDFQEGRTRIQQVRHTSTRQHFPPAFMPRPRRLAPAHTSRFRRLTHNLQSGEMSRAVRRELV